MAIFGDNFPTIFDDSFKNMSLGSHITNLNFEVLLTSCLALKGKTFLQLMVLFKMKKKEKRKRNKWVRELFRKREEKGAFNNLIQKMKLADRESFFR